MWVEHSRRYADPDTYLIPPLEWPGQRPEVMRQTGTPSDGLKRLEAREAELETAMDQVEKLLARKDSHVRVEDDELVLSPLEADNRPASAEVLEDRHDRKSTLVSSQFPLEYWHEAIGNPTLADAILDRLLHNAYKIILKGESMRKQRAALTAETASM